MEGWKEGGLSMSLPDPSIAGRVVRRLMSLQSHKRTELVPRWPVICLYIFQEVQVWDQIQIKKP